MPSGALRRYLECGILAHGFARPCCGECGHDCLIAFSCKGRGAHAGLICALTESTRRGNILKETVGFPIRRRLMLVVGTKLSVTGWSSSARTAAGCRIALATYNVATAENTVVTTNVSTSAMIAGACRVAAVCYHTRVSPKSPMTIAKKATGKWARRDVYVMASTGASQKQLQWWIDQQRHAQADPGSGAGNCKDVHGAAKVGKACLGPDR